MLVLRKTPHIRRTFLPTLEYHTHCTYGKLAVPTQWSHWQNARRVQKGEGGGGSQSCNNKAKLWRWKVPIFKKDTWIYQLWISNRALNLACILRKPLWCNTQLSEPALIKTKCMSQTRSNILSYEEHPSQTL